MEDCIVSKPYRRRHIARTLLKMVEEAFSGVDMITLIADADDATLDLFYTDAGYQKYAQKALVGYVRQVRQ